MGERVGQRERGVVVIPKSCSEWEMIEKHLARYRECGIAGAALPQGEMGLSS